MTRGPALRRSSTLEGERDGQTPTRDPARARSSARGACGDGGRARLGGSGRRGHGPSRGGRRGASPAPTAPGSQRREGSAVGGGGGALAPPRPLCRVPLTRVGLGRRAEGGRPRPGPAQPELSEPLRHEAPARRTWAPASLHSAGYRAGRPRGPQLLARRVLRRRRPARGTQSAGARQRASDPEGEAGRAADAARGRRPCARSRKQQARQGGILLHTLHRARFGAHFDIAPLNRAVMAALRAGSAANYVHVPGKRSTTSWAARADEIALAQKHAVAITRRGVGPARQSVPLPLAEVPCGVGRLCPKGEVEASLARCSHVELDLVTRTAAWRLLCTRSVPRSERHGLGDARAPRAAAPQASCAPGVASGGVWRRRRGSSALPDRVGAGLGEVRVRGTCIIGARWMVRLGIPIPAIQIFARWSSDAILRYDCGTPLEALDSRGQGHTLAPA